MLIRVSLIPYHGLPTSLPLTKTVVSLFSLDTPNFYTCWFFWSGTPFPGSSSEDDSLIIQIYAQWSPPWRSLLRPCYLKQTLHPSHFLFHYCFIHSIYLPLCDLVSCTYLLVCLYDCYLSPLKICLQENRDLSYPIITAL